MPVYEGYIWIPYDAVDQEEYELLVLDAACLLDAETCAHLAQEMRNYADELIASLYRVKRELESEAPAQSAMHQ